MLKQIQNICTVSKKILKYGIIASAFLFFCAGITYLVNFYYLQDSTLASNSIELIKASVTIFSEVIIGGLIIDYFSKNTSM